MHRVVLLLALIGLPATGFAQAAPDNKLAEGHSLYVGGNVEGALAVYEQVKADEPANAAAYYFVGCALAKLNRYDNALVVLNSGITVVGEQDKSLKAKILFVTAVIREQQGDLAAAKGAWNGYVRYAKQNKKALTYVSTAMARLKAIKQKAKLDEQYRVVRQRIASSK